MSLEIRNAGRQGNEAPCQCSEKGKGSFVHGIPFDSLTDFLFYHKKGDKKSRKRIPAFVIDY